MNPHVASRFRELEKHLLEACLTVEIRLRGNDIAETVRIVLMRYVRVVELQESI